MLHTLGLRSWIAQVNFYVCCHQSNYNSRMLPFWTNSYRITLNNWLKLLMFSNWYQKLHFLVEIGWASKCDIWKSWKILPSKYALSLWIIRWVAKFLSSSRKEFYYLRFHSLFLKFSRAFHHVILTENEMHIKWVHCIVIRVTMPLKNNTIEHFWWRYIFK